MLSSLELVGAVNVAPFATTGILLSVASPSIPNRFGDAEDGMLSLVPLKPYRNEPVP